MGIKMTNSGIAFRFQPSYNILTKQMSKSVDISENINYDGIRERMFVLLIKGELK